METLFKSPSNRVHHYNHIQSIRYSVLLIWLSLTNHLGFIYSRPSARPSNYKIVSDQSLKAIFNLSNPDPILDFNRPDSLLSQILIPRAVESDNLTHCRLIFEDHFKELSTTINVPRESQLFKNGQQPPSYSPEPIKEISTWQLERHDFTDTTPYGPKKFSSQIFTHDPTAPLRLVLAAHIDSKFFPTAPDNQFVGATDSAAPVAIILQVARALTPLLDDQLLHRVKVGDTSERITLQVVLLDGEEAFKDWSHTDSIYGARALAKKWSTQLRTPTVSTKLTRSLDQIQVFILLDLLGAPQPIIHNYFAETGWLFDSWQKAEDRLQRADFLFSPIKSSSERRPFFVQRTLNSQFSMSQIQDDHLPFLEQGVPILHLISSPFPSVWHQIQDDRSALDYQTIKEWNLISQVALIEYLGLESHLNSRNRINSRDELVFLP